MQITSTRLCACVKAKGGYFEHNLSWICWKLTWTRAADVAMNNISFSGKYITSNAFWYIWLQLDERRLFHKVQWLHFSGEVDTFIHIWCDVSSWFCVPKITQIYLFFTELFIKNQGVITFLKHCVFWPTLYMATKSTMTQLIVTIATNIIATRLRMWEHYLPYAITIHW